MINLNDIQFQPLLCSDLPRLSIPILYIVLFLLCLHLFSNINTTGNYTHSFIPSYLLFKYVHQSTDSLTIFFCPLLQYISLIAMTYILPYHTLSYPVLCYCILSYHMTIDRFESRLQIDHQLFLVGSVIWYLFLDGKDLSLLVDFNIDRWYLIAIFFSL